MSSSQGLSCHCHCPNPKASDWLDINTYVAHTYPLTGAVDEVAAKRSHLHTSVPEHLTTLTADLEPVLSLSICTTICNWP